MNEQWEPVPNWDGILDGTIPLPEDDKYLSLFDKSCLDQSKDYPPPVPIISLNQAGNIIPMLTLKSLSLWKGKQKSKKTTALALLTAAYIQQTGTGIIIASEPGKVLYIDTEQGESYGARTMKLILKLCGLTSSDNLLYSDMCEYTATEKMEMIAAAIERKPNVRLVVIDGLVDLMNDFMSSEEALNILTRLRKIGAKGNVHIAVVLHENKNDKNARAHVGSLGSQKCEMEISTEVDPNDRYQSLVVCTNSRGMPFETFAIRWDKGSLPTINEDWKDENSKEVVANRKHESKRKQANDVFKPLIAYQHGEAVEKIIIATGMSEPTAVRYLSDWTKLGFISKGDDGRYRRVVI